MNKFWGWFKSLFIKAALGFVELIKDAFPIAKQLIMSQLSAFGDQVIKEVAAGNLSNDQKRSEAFNRIKGRAGEVGIVITDSLINAFIEILYQRFKNKNE